MELAKRLINVAHRGGCCDAVKFQKSGPSTLFTRPPSLQKYARVHSAPRTANSSGRSSSGKEQYQEIDAHCKNSGIVWFASPWDEASVDFLESFNVSVP